jgi:hypothetical protein
MTNASGRPCAPIGLTSSPSLPTLRCWYQLNVIRQFAVWIHIKILRTASASWKKITEATSPVKRGNVKDCDSCQRIEAAPRAVAQMNEFAEDKYSSQMLKLVRAGMKYFHP